MSKRSIVLHLDEGWYDALSRQLNKKTFILRMS